MARIKFLFSRSHLLFLLAIAVGILLPQGAEIASVLTLPALTLILTITLLRFPRGFFRRPGPLLSGAVWGNVMNYLILGNLIIMASIFLIREEGFWVGMVLVAAAPPATTIIPLGKIRADADRLLGACWRNGRRGAGLFRRLDRSSAATLHRNPGFAAAALYPPDPVRDFRTEFLDAACDHAAVRMDRIVGPVRADSCADGTSNMCGPRGRWACPTGRSCSNTCYRMRQLRP